MNYHFNFLFSFLLASFLMLDSDVTFAKEVKEPDTFAEMPNSCQNIDPRSMTFELPLSIQKLTQGQQQKIKVIIDEGRTQACILQMQYDGLLQQIIGMFFEEGNVTEEQLKSFYEQLIILSRSRIENRFIVTLAIRKLLSDKEWQELIIIYTDYMTVKSKYILQQTELEHSYNVLIGGGNLDEFTMLSLTPFALYMSKVPKIQIIEQIIPTLSLTNIQKENVRNIMSQQEKQSYNLKQDMTRLVRQLLQLLLRQSEEIQAKQYQKVFSGLSNKEHLQEVYQIKTLLSLFNILTTEQKLQLREKYMLLKGIL